MTEPWIPNWASENVVTQQKKNFLVSLRKKIETIEKPNILTRPIEIFFKFNLPHTKEVNWYAEKKIAAFKLEFCESFS